MALFTKKTKHRSPKTDSTRRTPVATYYRSDKPTDSASPFARKPSSRPVRKFLFGFLDIIMIVILLLGLGYSLMLKPNPKIIASDLSFHGVEIYKSAAAIQLTQLKNRNKITINESTIANDLKKQFPEISNVQIELPFFSERPVIRLSIAKASIELISKNNNYIISSDGVAVARAGQLPQLKNLVVVNDESGFQVNLRSQVLSASSINFINNLIKQCIIAKVPIASLTMPPLAQELDLRTKDQPYYVKFYLGGDVLNETGQFLVARRHFIESSQTPSQYLDVRVSGKIFYK